MAVIEARGVSKQFLLKHDASWELKVRVLNLLRPSRGQSVEEFWAVRDVSLRIDRGEAVGLVGRNGSGKSTLLKMIAAIHRPTEGHLLVARGARIASMIELGVGFNSELTGRENVFLNAAIHGLTRAAIERIYDSVVSYSGLAHFIDVPIKNYSSGMYMRLGFAIAANLDPDILLLDEIFAVGDADFQQRCIGTLKRFMETGKTLIFVSHAPGAIRALCQRVCVLEQGRLTFDGSLEPGLAFYEQQIKQRAEAAAPGGARAETHDRDELALTPARHGSTVGADWEETGAWQFEFLRAQGLEPQDYVLDVGCASLAAAVHLLQFLNDGHYLGVESNRALLERGWGIELPRRGVDHRRGHYLIDETFDLREVHAAYFDYACATSLFPFVPFNGIARCIASVVQKLRPSGKFYATWYDNPDLSNVEPIARASGITTYLDRPPYHYPFSLIEQICHAVGATVERVETAHPRAESVLVISPASPSSPEMRAARG
jgi:ABC-type polysaccharide/polyol phosphate transport system ATPase subunit/SAM-dependent methyltransferase